MNDLTNKESESLRSTPRFRCPSCGSFDCKGSIGIGKIVIFCNKCGIEMDLPRTGTALEDACEIMNRAERLRYEVNRTKEEARN